MGRKRTNFAVAGCLFLALVTFAIYSSALRHPFVDYDDQDYVTENTHVQAALRGPSPLPKRTIGIR